MSLNKQERRQVENVEVSLLLRSLKENYGYDFSGYAQASLKRRLMALKRYFDVEHLADLISAILYDQVVAQTVINGISVPVSEFFRDAPVWQKVRDVVLPQLSSFPRINIWQAGCGHGEETYTLAILMHEAGLANRTRIYTSDINSSCLDEARQACWSRRRFEEWRSNYRNAGGREDFDRYFVAQGEQMAIREDLKQSIEFIKHNLVTDEVFKEVQWVVCRNVLIYFAENLQEKVLDLFLRSMERGAYLLLGRSERILDWQEKHPELEELDDKVQLYRKMIGAFRTMPDV